MTATQDTSSDYPVLKACIMVNTFQENESENENKTKLNKPTNETCKRRFISVKRNELSKLQL